ncbi:hypothetical protein MHU86_15089 [Fragilaria crotonensis]|nr:hypothetical protein MHU86_15089 [Fragilaria crotonensis]
MAVDTKQVVERHIGTPLIGRGCSWNSTSDVLAAINESLTTRAQVPGVSTGATREAEPAGTLPTATRGRPKKGSGTKHRAKPSKPVEASEDDTDDVTVVGFTMKPTVPVPAFIAAAIMDTYVTAPEELALLIVNAIKQRASEDPDPSRATIRAEAASYIPRWVLSVAVNSRRTRDRQSEVAASNAYPNDRTNGRNRYTSSIWRSELGASFGRTTMPARQDAQRTPFETCQRYWSDRQQTQRPRPPKRRRQALTLSRRRRNEWSFSCPKGTPTG